MSVSPECPAMFAPWLLLANDKKVRLSPLTPLSCRFATDAEATPDSTETR